MNQYLTIPQEIAGSYPEKIQRLLGYQSHGPSSASIPTRRTAVGFSRTNLTNLKPNVRCVAIRLTADEIGVPYVIESGI